MSDDPLHTYLEDHLAGASSALDLLEHLRDQHRGQSLGIFASEMLAEIEQDHATLEGFARRVAGGPHPLKDAAAKLAEKITRVKLSARTSGPLGVLESLEFLALGVWGKRSLWRALQTTVDREPRLRSLDLDRLVARAEAQYARIEEQRLEAAREALAGAPAGAIHSS